MLEAIVITLLIIINAIQLIYAKHLENKLEIGNHIVESFIVGHNEIRTVINTNADVQREMANVTSTHAEKIAYLMILNEILFKAVGVQKLEFKAESSNLAPKISRHEIF